MPFINFVKFSKMTYIPSAKSGFVIFPPRRVFYKKQHSVVGVFFHQPHELKVTSLPSSSFNRVFLFNTTS